jgi:C4-dicarboxylate transporter, DctM subunit
MVILMFVILFALIGAPVFAVMAGTTTLAWFLHPNPAMHHLRFLAPDVLDDRFAGSPILVTVPLFTFIGYLMAESKAPERIVRASNAFFGWLPGGLAIVCIFASAFFTTLTGGSAVTIVAIGALLYPALKKKGYPDDYSLGLIMTGGSLGLLLPPSLPLLIYSLVAGIDFTKAFKAGIIPGFLIIAILSAHAIWVGVRSKIPTTRPVLREMGAALWLMKWELGIPILILGGLATGLTELDESAAFASLYVLIVEVYIHKDIKLKEFPRIAKNAMALAGALLLIMAMAMSLTNFIISEQIPNQVFSMVTGMGVKHTWQFLLVLNVFLYIQGMVMDGLSAILVGVPLLIPFAAEFGLSPFHLMMMFILNLEIAFASPPLGQNLFVTSFRFNRPMISLYKIAMPFVGMLVVGLIMIMAFPKLSTAAVQGDIAQAKAKAAKYHSMPRDAFLLECVQEDRNNPQPCTPAEKKKWGALAAGNAFAGGATPAPSSSAAPDQNLLKQMTGGDAGAAQNGGVDDNLLKQMMGGGGAGATADGGAATPDAGAPKPASSGDDLFNQMMNAK